MCRLALFNKEGFNLIEEKYGIEKFLLRLQKEQGGSGEGLALSNDEGKVFFIRKGVKYKIDTIVKHLRTLDWKWCIYHTRIASVGSINDKNCHPFKSNDIVLAMNGTETNFSGLAKALDITDTEAVLLSITKFKLDLFNTLKPLKSNFIGFKNGVPFATSSNDWKSYEIAKDDKGAVVISSSLPTEFTKYEPIDKPFLWREGEELKVKEKKVYVSTYTTKPSVFRSTKEIVKKWNYKIKEETKIEKTIYDYRRYECSGCEEIIRGDELIEDMGETFCPLCGEEITRADIFYAKNYLLD